MPQLWLGQSRRRALPEKRVVCKPVFQTEDKFPRGVPAFQKHTRCRWAEGAGVPAVGPMWVRLRGVWGEQACCSLPGRSTRGARTMVGVETSQVRSGCPGCPLTTATVSKARRGGVSLLPRPRPASLAHLFSEDARGTSGRPAAHFSRWPATGWAAETGDNRPGLSSMGGGGLLTGDRETESCWAPLSCEDSTRHPRGCHCKSA